MRILAIPFFLYYLLLPDVISRFIALAIFVGASLTDFLDGFLARRLKMETKLGRFLDPLADKFLVIATLIAFLFLDEQIPIWMVLVIIARDFLITFMRYLAIRKGYELKTTRLAKAKTAFQMLSIVLILMILVVRSSIPDIERVYMQGILEGKTKTAIATEHLKEAWTSLKSQTITETSDGRKVFARFVPYFLMYITAVLTLLSGVRYIYSNYQIFLPPYTSRKIAQKRDSDKENE